MVSGGMAPPLPVLVLGGGEWPASLLLPLYSPAKKYSVPVGGLDRPRAGLDAMEKRTICCPAGNRTRAVQPVAIPSALSRVTDNVASHTANK